MNPDAVSVFQPTCGTLRGRRAAMRVQRPGINARPGTPGASSLPSNSHCIPRQMPRSGMPVSTRSRMALLHSCVRSAVAAK
jgi:hypothetical protein